MRVRKLIGSAEAKAIIDFVKKNEGTTSDNVAKQLKQEGTASRITTLSAIDALIRLGAILDDRKGRYSHRLKYNEDYNFYDLGLQLLAVQAHEIKADIHKLSKNDEGDKLFDEIEDYIISKHKPLTKYLQEQEQEQRIQMIEGIPATPGLYSNVATKIPKKRKSKKTET